MSMAADICRDFEKGDCRRMERCKFFHPTLMICRDFQNKKCEREKCRYLHVSREEEELYNGSGVYPDHLDQEDAKRKRNMDPYGGGGGGGGGGRGRGQDFDGGMYGKRRREDYPPSGMFETPVVVLQENEMLKQKVSDLQRQILELRQMNDTLYEQNTKFRTQLSTTNGSVQTSMPSYDPVGAGGPATNPSYYGYGYPTAGRP